MSAALQQEIQRYTAHGYHVVHQTETTAQLRKPKEFNVLAFLLLGILLFVIGAVIYLAIYASRKDQYVYLSVGEDNQVYATGAVLVAGAPQGPRTRWDEWAVGKSHEEFVAEHQRAIASKAAPEYIRWLESKIATFPQRV